MSVGIPEAPDARLEIVDKGTYYDILYSRGEFWESQGTNGPIPCPEHTGPHGTFGNLAPTEDFHFDLPTAYLGSQAPYPDPVIDVAFLVVGIIVERQWVWFSPPCFPSLTIGAGSIRRYLDPPTNDVNGDPVDLSGTTPAHWIVDLGARATNTWPALAWEVDTTECHHIWATTYIFGWARKSGTPPDPDHEPPETPRVPFILPPCLEGPLLPGKPIAGQGPHGVVRLDG